MYNNEENYFTKQPSLNYCSNFWRWKEEKRKKYDICFCWIFTQCEAFLNFDGWIWFLEKKKMMRKKEDRLFWNMNKHIWRPFRGFTQCFCVSAFLLCFISTKGYIYRKDILNICGIPLHVLTLTIISSTYWQSLIKRQPVKPQSR